MSGVRIYLTEQRGARLVGGWGRWCILRESYSTHSSVVVAEHLYLCRSRGQHRHASATPASRASRFIFPLVLPVNVKQEHDHHQSSRTPPIVKFPSLKRGIVSESRYTFPRIYTRTWQISERDFYRVRDLDRPSRKHGTTETPPLIRMCMGLDVNVVSTPVPAHVRSINFFSDPKHQKRPSVRSPAPTHTARPVANVDLDPHTPEHGPPNARPKSELMRTVSSKVDNTASSILPDGPVRVGTMAQSPV